jgi:RNA polymerase sigma factor (sigma-70 family)
MSERPDRELVELAQRGDPAAMGELFSRYWRAARGAAFGVTGEFASAEDAAAGAFQQALAGLSSLRDPERFGPWLRTIVLREARLSLEQRRPSLDALALDPSDRSEPPEEVLERIELAGLIQHAVRELPDRLREAVALVYFEGYDTDAAASFLEIPAGTLRRRLHEGRASLRSMVNEILQGNKRMGEEQQGKIEKFKARIENGEVYEALRESLALRPPPRELVDVLLKDRIPVPEERMRDLAQRALHPSERSLDPAHPVGAISQAIRKALPEFQDWQLDGEAAVRFLTFQGEHRDRLKIVLPPGFAEGKPGSYIRATRAIVQWGAGARSRSIYEHLEASPSAEAFVAGAAGMRMSDVVDLTWMAHGSIELRSVQDLLERLSSAVLPGVQIRFSSYSEPRYRAALQLEAGGDSTRAALGGVLAPWPGRPENVDAAHIRIFLEPWASIRSGQPVEVEALPPGKDRLL